MFIGNCLDPIMGIVNGSAAAVVPKDANRSTAEVAQAAGLSQSPCWRRIDRLEREGLILRNRKGAILVARKLDLVAGRVLQLLREVREHGQPRREQIVQRQPAQRAVDRVGERERRQVRQV